MFGKHGHHGFHGVVDPHIDGAEFLLEMPGRGKYRLGVGDIGGGGRGLRAHAFDLPANRLQRLRVPADQADLEFCRGETMRKRAANSRGRSGDDDDVV